MCAILGGRFALLEAGDGEEALRAVRTHRPDLLLLDVNMPGRDGLQVCRLLKEAPDTRHIKVVLVSARATPSDQAKGRAAGADDYVTKPFSPRDLLLLVERLLADNR